MDGKGLFNLTGFESMGSDDMLSLSINNENAIVEGVVESLKDKMNAREYEKFVHDPANIGKLKKISPEGMKKLQDAPTVSMAELEKVCEECMQESAEFDSNCPSVNPTQHVDAANSGEKDVAVPGGDKEDPTAKPEGGEFGPSVPGGDKETPSAKPYDAASVPTPAKVTLDADTYNSVLQNLKKSFQEGAELMGMLENASVITKSTEELQEEFTENAIADAILESLENGPMFEKVNKDDKNDIKGIVKKIRDNVDNFLSKEGLDHYKPNFYARVFTGFIPGLQQNLVSAIHQDSVSFIWQMLCVVHCEEANIKDLCDKMNEKLSDDLDGYKVIYVKTSAAIADLFRSACKKKNAQTIYFLIVDKKLPSEVSEAMENMEKNLKKADNAGKK